MDQREKRVYAFDQPAVYRIQIQGKLESRWITDMCDMTVQHEGGEDRQWVTTLTGELVDQAALLGLLNMVYNYGCPLLSLENLSRADQTAPSDELRTLTS